ncbi:MAG: hypothetical protein K0S42_1062 [Microvirga sp.]|nr:hypothetical protein [Microvirga sp.]
MIIDQTNQKIGRADHIREVGPHAHDWVDVGRDGAGEIYRECLQCGSRSTTASEHTRAQRRDWLAGGKWDVKAEKQQLLPATQEDVAEAVEEQREAELEMGEEDLEADVNDSAQLPKRRGRPPKIR